MNQPNVSPEAKRLLDMPLSMIKPPTAASGLLQEVFNLDEGPVTLTVPADMSAQSYEDLKDYFELFLRKAKRRAEAANQDVAADLKKLTE